MMLFKSGSPHMVDYTPDAAVTAGSVVFFLGKPCIAHRDIAADELGALAWPCGTTVYEITDADDFQAAEDTLAAGDILYAQTADSKLTDTATAAVALGITMGAIGSAAGGVGVRVIHGG